MNYKDFFKTQFTGLAFVLGIICIALSFFMQKELFTYVAFILLFTVFDVVGYGNMIELIERYEDNTIKIPYRIMQNMFMVITFITVYFYTGWQCLIACIIGWWCGGCDLLYYILLRGKVSEQDYYWMKGWSVWLPITLMRRLLLADEYIGRVEFIIICSVGLVLGSIINFVKL
jgi:hypothetical protein